MDLSTLFIEQARARAAELGVTHQRPREGTSSARDLDALATR
ncbi:hypothetical protein [Nocardioides ferulae]|nr:hypothetical protein [Nocardioides ferulae]